MTNVFFVKCQLILRDLLTKTQAGIFVSNQLFADYDQITFNSCTKYELFLALMEELFPWQGQITLTCPTTLLLSFKQLYRHCH